MYSLCSIFTCAMRLTVLSLLLAIAVMFVFVPKGIKPLNFLHSDIAPDEQDHFLQVLIIKQQHPIQLGADIPITLETKNAGKLPLSSRKMWLEFMHKQLWINIPELEPGTRCSLEVALPYPGGGAVAEIDKLVRVGVDGATCNVMGFYIDIETFAPGIYTKTSSAFVPELNVLVISHKPSANVDLLNSVRALEPQKYNRVGLRQHTIESISGTSLFPLFAVQMWEAVSVEPLEKNRFYFESLINGSGWVRTLYSLDDHLLQREVSRLPVEVHVVLFVIPNEVPAEVIRGVNSIWNVAETAQKRPLLMVVNGTNQEDAVAKFSTPFSDTICVPLNKTEHNADVRVLRAIHQIIMRGENALAQKRNITLLGEHSYGLQLLAQRINGDLILGHFLLLVTTLMVFNALWSCYREVRSNFSTKKASSRREIQIQIEIETKRDNHDILEVNAQGTFTEKSCDSQQDQSEDSGEVVLEKEPSVIYITLERIIEKQTQEEYELDVTVDEEAEGTDETKDSLDLTQSDADYSFNSHAYLNPSEGDLSIEGFEELKAGSDGEIGDEKTEEEQQLVQNDVVQEEQGADTKSGEEEEGRLEVIKGEGEVEKEVPLVPDEPEEAEEGVIAQSNEESDEAKAKKEESEANLKQESRDSAESKEANVEQQGLEGPEQSQTLLASHIDIIENYGSSSLLSIGSCVGIFTYFYFCNTYPKKSI